MHTRPAVNHQSSFITLPYTHTHTHPVANTHIHMSCCCIHWDTDGPRCTVHTHQHPEQLLVPIQAKIKRRHLQDSSSHTKFQNKSYNRVRQKVMETEQLVCSSLKEILFTAKTVSSKCNKTLTRKHLKRPDEPHAFASLRIAATIHSVALTFHRQQHSQ